MKEWHMGLFRGVEGLGLLCKGCGNSFLHFLLATSQQTIQTSWPKIVIIHWLMASGPEWFGKVRGKWCFGFGDVFVESEAVLVWSAWKGVWILEMGSGAHKLDNLPTPHCPRRCLAEAGMWQLKKLEGRHEKLPITTILVSHFFGGGFQKRIPTLI